MLGVVDDLAPVCFQMAHGVRDHPAVFRRVDAEDVGDVQTPAFAEDRHHGRLGREQLRNLRVFFHGEVCAARAAEGGELRAAEASRLGGVEKGGVLRVGPGPAALDVVHAERIEFFGDAQLVQHAKVDALALRAVAQGGVVEGEAWRR